ncbi:MAG: D-glycero-beta-D-manno-heptose 1-phosphate adenylyltransferase [Deltaproteobacteria bacterium]|nr:D-glycero-beta-D-manno-heptose 1-phosphate adenylyltransferase [Deltaproteobacteria bacterium]
MLAPAAAAKFCRRASAGGRRVVFTNGCFDILHPGHVTYLEAARGKGDFLVVALDSDAAVRELKGPERPINNLKSRMQVLAALESVDAVTWFTGGNPIPIISRIRPDILVKGGDWKISEILGSKEVLSWGGRVYSLNFVAGKSTTNIVNKIRKR